MQLGGWFKAAREAEPANTELELALGEVREMRGELDKAEEIYRKVLTRTDLPPAQRATAANNLAFILSTQRKSTEESVRVDRRGDAGHRPELRFARYARRCLPGG